MLSDNEPDQARNKNLTILILGATLIAIILMVSCILSILLLRPQNTPRATPTREMLLIDIPTAIPANQYSVSLPVILSGSRPAPVMSEPVEQSQIWTVIKIKSLGYEANGQRNDVAVFKRVGGQETVKAYCINRGWETPDIGTEYLLNTDGIFVPLRQRDVDPLQRFMMIP